MARLLGDRWEIRPAARPSGKADAFTWIGS